MGKKIILKGVFLFLLFLLVLPIIISQPPPETITNVNIETGITVTFPPIYTIKQNENLNVHNQAFNISNGKRLYNDTTSCYVHLYDNTMGHLFVSEMEMENEEGQGWNILIDKGNFTRLGKYGLTVQCNTSEFEGFRKVELTVTQTGKEFTTEKAIIYIGLLGILILIFIINVGSIHFLPSQDLYDNDEKLISINHLKYLRPIFVLTSWFILLAIMYVSSNIALAYLEVTLIGDLFFNFFQIMMLLSYPIVLLFLIYLFYKIFDDNRMKQIMERGLVE